MPKRGSVRNLIIETLHKEGDLTCDELEQVTGLSHQTASGSLSTLQKNGFVGRTNVPRKTRSGSNANPYVLTNKGTEEFKKD